MRNHYKIRSPIAFTIGSAYYEARAVITTRAAYNGRLLTLLID